MGKKHDDMFRKLQNLLTYTFAKKNEDQFDDKKYVSICQVSFDHVNIIATFGGP